MPLTDFLSAAENGGYAVSTPRYVIGGTAEVRLPRGFGVECDALYRRLHYDGFVVYTVPFTGLSALLNTKTTGNNWEFPLLLKYRFRSSVARPYLDVGVAWDTLTGLKQSVSGLVDVPVEPVGSQTPPASTTTSHPLELIGNTTTGFVVGGGVDIHLFLHISPEVRYTRWNSSQIGATGGLLRSNPNQVEFLTGFTF